MKFRNRLAGFALAAALFVSAVPVNAMAAGDVKEGVAWITGNKLRLRASASTKGKTLDSAAKGDVALVLDKKGEWCKVEYNDQIGYMHSDYLDVEKKENVELGYGKVTGNKVNLRKGAGTSYQKVTRANKNDKVYIIGINNGWYKVIFESKICYIRSDYVETTEIPYENADSDKEPLFFENGKSTGLKVSAKALKNAEKEQQSQKEETKQEENQKEETQKEEIKEEKPSAGKPADTAMGQKIVEEAKKYLGTPYVWSGASPDGFDCSGFVYYIYKTMGISIPRTQEKMYSVGNPVDRDKLQPGDIVFFQNTYRAGISHCGIYVGDEVFIHSSTSGDTVRYSDLDSKYYTEHYYGAVRIVP